MKIQVNKSPFIHEKCDSCGKLHLALKHGRKLMCFECKKSVIKEILEQSKKLVEMSKRLIERKS